MVAFGIRVASVRLPSSVTPDPINRNSLRSLSGPSRSPILSRTLTILSSNSCPNHTTQVTLSASNLIWGAIKSVGQFFWSSDQYLFQSWLARTDRSWSMASALRSNHQAPAILRRFWSTCLWPLSTSPELIGSPLAKAPA